MDIWHLSLQSASKYFIHDMDNLWFFSLKQWSLTAYKQGITTCQLIKKDVKLISAPSITSTYGKTLLENIIYVLLNQRKIARRTLIMCWKPHRTPLVWYSLFYYICFLYISVETKFGAYTLFSPFFEKTF